MSKEQKEVLRYMNQNNIGAIPVNGHWVFPQEVRDSIAIAETIHERLLSGGAL